MSRHKVVKSDDSTTIVIEGDRRSPEPTTAAIVFPGGSLEVSRVSGEYWAHIAVNPEPPIDGASVRESATGSVVDSRIDYKLPRREILDVPHSDEVQHLALRIALQ